MADSGGFPLHRPEIRIGDYLGLTMVHVNRVLKRLRDGGLATIQNKIVSIHDPEALQTMAFQVQDVFEQRGAAAENGEAYPR